MSGKPQPLANLLTSGQSFDSFIDDLIESLETIIEKGMPQTTTTMALLEQDLDSRSLRSMELKNLLKI